jgi:hypothetical protein
MHAINRNTSIVNHKSINLSNSDSGCTCVHGLGASPKQASCAAPRQRLAAINITQWFNSFTAHKKNDSSKGSEESQRGLTASRMGLRKTANTRRASRRAVLYATQSSEEAGEVPGLQEQRCFVVEELRSEGHCLGARMGDGAAALRRAAAGRWAEEGARNSKGRCPRWDGARPWGVAGETGAPVKGGRRGSRP